MKRPRQQRSRPPRPAAGPEPGRPRAGADPAGTAARRPRFVRVADAAELAAAGMLVVEVEGRDLVVVNVEGRVYALDNRCPHLGGPLGRGRLEERAIVCPWHGWRWDPKSGRALWPAVDWRATSYPVLVEDGQILVRVA